VCFSEFILLTEDFDNDGYLSLSDLRSACEKFKIPNSSAMVLQSGGFCQICLGSGLGCFSKSTWVSAEVCFKNITVITYFLGTKQVSKNPLDTPPRCLMLFVSA